MENKPDGKELHRKNPEQLLEALRKVPDEAFERLQYFQPEIGCFNACSFCSQEAGAAVWQLSKESVKELVDAIAIVTKERGIKVAAGRTEHRPGVLFPYLDNDIFSYPNLDTFLKETYEQLGTKTRIASVGYSRNNEQLQKMHERIVSELGDSFAGIRFSITPFTGGWAARGGGKLARDEYELDLANSLKTYLPLMKKMGFSNETACCELRFQPHIQNVEVVDTLIDGHHVIKSGPHLLVRKKPGIEPLAISHTTSVSKDEIKYDNPSEDYFLITSDNLGLNPDWREVVEDLLSGVSEVMNTAKQVSVQAFENNDGKYYAIDFNFHPDGTFNALHIYPKTERRSISGYNNASRYFLNSILKIKSKYGFGRREKFDSATWGNVDEIIEELKSLAENLLTIDVQTSLHITRNILPLVESYIKVLKIVDVPAPFVFDNLFTIDTGQIVNQGRAKKLFKGIVTTDDDPLTPRESRAYGDDASVSAQRGKIWRLVPMPDTETALSKVKAGGKAIVNPTPEGLVAFHEVSEHTLRPVDVKTGQPLRNFTIPGVSLTHRERHQSWDDFLQPGVIKKDNK